MNEIDWFYVGCLLSLVAVVAGMVLIFAMIVLGLLGVPGLALNSVLQS